MTEKVAVITVETDQTCTVKLNFSDYYIPDFPGYCARGLSPEAAVNVQQMLETAYKMGRQHMHEKLRRVVDSTE